MGRARRAPRRRGLGELAGGQRQRARRRCSRPAPGQAQVTPFDSLEAFTGGSHQVAFENAPAQVAKLEDVEARGGKVIASTLSTPLVVRGPYGFGRVTVIGLDVDTKPFADWPDRGLFWVKALDLKGSNAGGRRPAGGQARGSSDQNVSDLATLLRRALDQFPGVTLIPFGWVAFFIFLYILLIGPGDYFFLKKVVKRMELTWITFPTIVVTVSLLAYYAAYVVKGTDLRVNKVDVVDIDLEAEAGAGDELDQPVQPAEPRLLGRGRPAPARPSSPPTDPKAVAAAAAGDRGPAELVRRARGGLRGMNTRSRGMGFGGGGYSYAPLGKAEELEGRPGRDLEHQGVHRPLVRPRPGARVDPRRRPPARRDRPPGRDDHQPPARRR